MQTGSAVSGNTATYAGGGVHVSGSTFTMNGGSVSGNSIANSGGGVYVYDSGASSTFTMKAGSAVSGNIANNGGGVYVGGSSFTMSGSAVVDAGNKVYLVSGKVITLSGELSANPAANIEPESGAEETTPLLVGDLEDGDPQNYTRFLVNGEREKIGSDGIYVEP
jgi:hypothetical protein